jgi:hypothetical protein
MGFEYSLLLSGGYKSTTGEQREHKGSVGMGWKALAPIQDYDQV